MRTPVVIKEEPYDLGSAKSAVAAVRNAFDRYLDHYIPKSLGSKHGLMGPIGKILGEARSGRGDLDYLKGYVLRVHELSQTRSPSPEALQALEEGIGLLVQLLREAPVTVHDRLVDQVDYGLYFARRKKFIQWLDGRNRDYQAWLRERHGELSSLNQAWGTQVKSWDDLRYGGTGSKAYKTATSKQREDMDRFAKQVRESGKPMIPEDDAEEEAL